MLAFFRRCPRKTAQLTPMSKGTPDFQTTLWSQVLLAARSPDSSNGKKAVAQLCEIYWCPVYAFIRRQGASLADAEDLTQGFFEQVLCNGFFTRADPDRGRFRNFLLNAVRNYLGDQHDRQKTQRRGGSAEKISINMELAESWLSADPSPTIDPIRVFDRLWATAVIDHSLRALEKEQASAGKAGHFELLKEFLQRSAAPGEYDAIAGRLGISKGAVSVSVHRLSERLGELVRKNVRDTVVKPEMADEEMKFLFSSLSG
jgi:RNA polymerase sigma factor (sigma-70 family)